MAQLNVLFDVPKWVEAGVRTGNLTIVGGVVRNSGGSIAYMLKEGTKVARFAKGPWLLVALGIAGAAAVGYGIYKLVSSKPKALDELAAVDRAILTYASEAQGQHLTVEHIQRLASEFQKLIAVMESPEFKDADFVLDADAAGKLCEFYASLQSFNLRLQEQVQKGGLVPQLVKTDKLLELAHGINEQLIFQKDLVPAYVVAT